MHYPQHVNLFEVLRDGVVILSSSGAEFAASTASPPSDHAGRAGEAFRESKRRVQWTREHVWVYDAALLSLLLVLLVLHLRSRWVFRRRKAERLRAAASLSEVPVVREDDGGCASDSSSTLTGTATPPDLKKKEDAVVVDESSPLLSSRLTARPKANWIQRTRWRIRAFWMHQPKNMPFFNKVLTNNGTILFILSFFAMNVFFAAVNIPFERKMIMVLGDRFANLFAANLPLLYLLGAKNQPIKYLTGLSYEALNIFHRRLGEMMCLFAVLHAACSLFIYFDMVQPLLGISFWRFINNTLILCGIGALFCYETLYLTSLGSFRQRWYELFLASHVFLQAGGLAFLWFHYSTSRGYICVCVAIFLVDRIVFRLLTKSTHVKASLEVLEDGETVWLHADWPLPTPCRRWFVKRSVRYGWDPAAHVFVTAPALSKSAVLQAHPFTIASAAPGYSTTKPYAWLSLLIRAHSGFSRDLLEHAKTQSTINVRFDGPYGSTEPLELLEESDVSVIVAGGSGIAVAFPLLWALLCPDKYNSNTEFEHHMLRRLRRSKQRVCLIWVIHSESHWSWIPAERLAELEEWGLDIRIPPATSTCGRPNVGGMVSDTVSDYVAEMDGNPRAGVIVSGPDALNRDVRNSCAGLVGRGLDVRVMVEKFGW